MEQLVLLLVIAAISLVNWLIERSAKLREKRRLQKDDADRTRSAPPAEPSPVPEASAREELEEHMRRMMESFGFPVEEPGPAPQRTAPLVVVEEPSAPPPLPRRPQPSVPRPALRKSKAAAPAVRLRSPWIQRLGSPQGLREAVVLREILGPPKAFSES